jgi:hypothetical protein
MPAVKNSIAQIHLRKLQIDGDAKRTWTFRAKALYQKVSSRDVPDTDTGIR